MHNPPPVTAGPALISPDENRRMFDTISRRYDLLNDLQSFGLHRRWKRRVAELAAAEPGAGAQPGAAAPEGGDNAGIAAQLADAAQTLTASAQSFDLGSVLQPYFAGVDAFATSATSSIEAVNTAALTSQQNLAALKQRLDNLPDPNADDADISGTGASAR